MLSFAATLRKNGVELVRSSISSLITRPKLPILRRTGTEASNPSLPATYPPSALPNGIANAVLIIQGIFPLDTLRSTLLKNPLNLAIPLPRLSAPLDNAPVVFDAASLARSFASCAVSSPISS